MCGKGAERWVVGRGIGMWREMGVGWMVGWGGGGGVSDWLLGRGE